jgi:hypothetical protein
MSFDDLSNESKLLFVIFATEREAGFHCLLSNYYECGAPMGSYREASAGVTAFVQDSQRTSAEERRRRMEDQQKVKARMRA